jgi:hypothetical protein
MRLSRLFPGVAAPVCRNELLSDGEQMARAHISSSRAPSAVFDLLGVRSDMRSHWAKGDAVGADADRLIERLYARYCEVIVSPHMFQTGEWNDLVSDAPSALAGAASDDHEQRNEGMSTGSTILDVLGDINRLDEAFRPLERSSSLAAPEAAPEILRLFAPKAFQRERAPRRAALPPDLAQREHHALAIDSPLPSFGTTAANVTQDSE